MPSRIDDIMTAHVGAGRTTGSSADRGQALLISKGAPSTGSLADKQVALGKKVKDHINPVDYP